MSLNQVTLIGNLGGDPDLTMTESGRARCKFSLATDESYTRDGERKERTEWHNIVTWGNNAESAAKYLKKGAMVAVVGSLQTRNYDDKEGKKRYITEVVARRVKFLNLRNSNSSTPTDITDEEEPAF